MFKKLNNKGDTLAIVLIGMFVLSILGTLILGVTATNFNMKVSDKKAESAFYFAEKAVDEVYAGIGREVMSCIQEEYTDVVEKYYSNYKNNPTAYDATSDFKLKVRDELTDLYIDDDVKVQIDAMGNPTGVSGIDALYSRILELDAGGNGKYIKNITGATTANEFTLSGADNYKFTIFSPATSTTIEYYKKTINPAGTIEYTNLASVDTYDKVERIIIRNFGIRCDSESNGYSSSIVTDFVIDVPNIEIDLSDSQLSGDNLGDLAQYSLIAQGHRLIKDCFEGTTNNRKAHMTSDMSAISISDSANVVINGNVYADGTLYEAERVVSPNGFAYYKNVYEDPTNPLRSTILSKGDSIRVGGSNGNVNLEINSKVFASINDFIVKKGSDINMGNKDNTDSFDSLNSLQFYVNNIKTENSGSDRNTVLNIKGNCIVKDDLQLDGDYNRITLAGNYFGYGYRGNIISGHLEESNSSAIQGYTEINTFDENNSEHESSSAIIINGKNTELNMSDVRKTVIMGRSYIDLEDSGTKSYYMTGESISFKGNQHMYLASSELNGSKVVGRNPIPFIDLQGITGKSSGISYSDLDLPDGRVVAKKMGNDVYFYVVNSNPVAQTNYFINSYNNNERRAALLSKLDELEVNEVRVGGVVYSVGAVTTVDSSSGTRTLLTPSSGNNGISEQQALTIVDVIQSRVKHLTPYLQDDSSKYVLGSDNTKEPDNPVATTAKTPYEYYVDREELFKLIRNRNGNHETRLTVGIMNNGVPVNGSLSGTGSDGRGLTDADLNTLANQIRDIMNNEGVSLTGKKVGYWISNEQGSSPQEVNIDIGVIIAESPISVNRDFIGLILTNDEIVISGGSVANPITISACEELTKLLLRTCPDLYDVLTAEVKTGSSGTTGTGTVVKADSLKYTDIVKKENWKRDTDY